MLEELHVRQKIGEPPRRWFADDYFDLIVWFAPDSSICAFQLCYDKKRSERALTWTLESGFSRHRVDAGEQKPSRNDSPILVADGNFQRGQLVQLVQRMTERGTMIDASILGFVLQRLRAIGME